MSVLAVFDLDNTLLAADSDYLWGHHLVGLGLVDGESYDRQNRQFMRDYEAGLLDMAAFCRFSLAPLAALDRSLLEAIRADFVRDQIAPIVAAGAPALLDHHRDRGDELLITTATNRFVTEPIAALLGVRHLIATDPAEVEGRFTGDVAGIPNFREGKVIRLRAWIAASTRQFEAIECYSDSRNDLPLLEFSSRAVAVDPDPVLRANAIERGWQVISLR